MPKFFLYRKYVILFNYEKDFYISVWFTICFDFKRV